MKRYTLLFVFFVGLFATQIYAQDTNIESSTSPILTAYERPIAVQSLSEFNDLIRDAFPNVLFKEDSGELTQEGVKEYREIIRNIRKFPYFKMIIALKTDGDYNKERIKTLKRYARDMQINDAFLQVKKMKKSHKSDLWLTENEHLRFKLQQRKL